ncbi:MAG: AraC family transcriptional regulator [Verrucomicrobiota bacterium JB024]|nr:AraC family transcriptional regulator [Verrucomicrobiota bacterium JB024]
MRHSDLVIAAIAEEVGEHNAMYFSRLFKRLIGTTPKVLRTPQGLEHLRFKARLADQLDFSPQCWHKYQVTLLMKAFCLIFLNARQRHRVLIRTARPGLPGAVN